MIFFPKIFEMYLKDTYCIVNKDNNLFIAIGAYVTKKGSRYKQSPYCVIHAV
jgi:hypothetical protein